MPGCIFHVVGKAFDPIPMFQSLTLRPYAVFRAGDKMPAGARYYDTSGFKYNVGNSDGELRVQITDAIEFLSIHSDAIAQLGTIPEIESMYLSFGCWLRMEGSDIVCQSDYLPPELIRRAGMLNVGIEICHYPQEKQSGNIP